MVVTINRTIQNPKKEDMTCLVVSVFNPLSGFHGTGNPYCTRVSFSWPPTNLESWSFMINFEQVVFIDLPYHVTRKKDR